MLDASQPIKKDVRLALSTNIPSLADDGNRFSAVVALSVKFDISNPGGEVVASGAVKGGAKASVPKSAITRGDPLRLLRVNAVSIL